MELQLAGACRQPQNLVQMHGLAIGQHLLHHHVRQRVPVALQRPRIHRCGAARSGDPQVAAPIAHRRRSGAAVALRTDESVRLAEMIDGELGAAAAQHRLRLVPRDAQHAAVRCQPQVAKTVVEDGEQRIHRQAVLQAQPAYPALAVAQQPAVGGQPHRAVGVFVEIEDVLRAAD